MTPIAWKPDAPSLTEYFAEPRILQGLQSFEFGDRTELTVRVALIVIGGIGFSAYDSSQIGVMWLTLYLLSQIVAYVLIARAPPDYGIGRAALGVLAYVVTTVLFLAFPMYVMAYGAPGAALCGGVALIIFAIFTIWRDDAPRVLTPIDVGLGWMTASSTLLVSLPLMESMFGHGMAIILTVALATYYTMALVSSRRAKRKLKQAAERGLEAQKMEALGRLSGGIAHDFNNILTVLQGNLELHQEIQDPVEREKLVRDAYASAQRASGLVRQLLSFARRAPLSPRRIEAGDIVETLHAMAQRLLPSSVTVTAMAPSVRLPINVDDDGLLSALLNLVINARDAMGGRGTITLSASLARHPSDLAGTPLDAGRYVAFRVADTGHGIPPEMIDKALEPFFTTKPVGAGSGLGLPSAKGFAEQSGGALKIASQPGATTITLFVPLADTAGDTAETAPSKPREAP